jgi:hypothetical protein
MELITAVKSFMLQTFTSYQWKSIALLTIQEVLGEGDNGMLSIIRQNHRDHTIHIHQTCTACDRLFYTGLASTEDQKLQHFK